MPKDLEVCILVSVCIHCLLAQTFPHVSFQRQTLANHSYVALSLVGDVSGSDSVVCHTDVNTCCTSTDGAHRGDWYFPNGTRLPFSGFGNIYEVRLAQSVNVGYRNQSTPTSAGIYRCDIPTVAVHDDDDISVRDTVYVGLYLMGGEQC